MNKAAPYLLTCLLTLLATAAQAVPVSFQFSTVIQSVSPGFPPGGGPSPYDDPFALLGASITGSFTVETAVETFPAEVFENGQLIPVGLFYWNPVLRYDLTVAGQSFSFVSARPTFDDGIQESSFVAHDLPAPRNNPAANYDVLDLGSDFGVGQFGAPFAGLSVFADLVRSEFDLTQIQSTDMLLGLTTPAEWDFFFTVFQPETGIGTQVHGIVTDLQQVAIATPEPGTVGLFVVGLGILGLVALRRRSTAASG
jgi:hypothetical protein